MARVETYQGQRAEELGLPIGTGKGYRRRDLEAFYKTPTIETLARTEVPKTGYQVARAAELGLPEGTGKGYSQEDLEAFNDQTFEGKLFASGILVFDEEWAKATIDRTLAGWSSLPTEKLKNKKGEFRKFKAGSPNAREQHRRMSDGANIKIFENVHMFFEGRIPASWRYPDVIVETYRSAKATKVLLTPDLIRFGLVHPVTQVRTALCENQELTAQQKMIVGYMGIDSKDPEINMVNRMGPAGGPPFFMIAMANEFEGYQMPLNYVTNYTP